MPIRHPGPRSCQLVMGNLECAYAMLDIFESEESEVGGLIVQPLPYPIMNVPGDHDAVGTGILLQPGCNIHAVTVNVIAFGDDISHIDGHTELEGFPIILRSSG